MTIPTGFKPMLAATLTKPELIKFPVWASPKIDGIRCVIFDGAAYSRSLKPIPNPYVQEVTTLFARWLEGYDGELVVGSPTDPNCMQNTTSGVMKKSGEPDFTFYVFDRVADCSFDARQTILEDDFKALYRLYPELDVRLVPQVLCASHADLDENEARWLAEGYEGMMIRSPDGKYKFGRSTEREGGLVKVKRFTDAEAIVIGFEEEMHNANEATRNATGRTERSTAQAGLVGKGTLGALRVVMPVDSRFPDSPSVVFSIGTGFTAAQRRDYWQDRESLVGRIVKFKHFDHGTVDAPRHPVFIGFRHPEDMG
ncbi:ATP-dependent DNA ligase [Burkholderia multivorans]|nr:ATP-dependent DNA ligase [Burkholderia multivorans]